MFADVKWDLYINKLFGELNSDGNSRLHKEGEGENFSVWNIFTTVPELQSEYCVRFPATGRFYLAWSPNGFKYPMLTDMFGSASIPDTVKSIRFHAGVLKTIYPIWKASAVTFTPMTHQDVKIQILYNGKCYINLLVRWFALRSQIIELDFNELHALGIPKELQADVKEMLTFTLRYNATNSRSKFNDQIITAIKINLNRT